MKKEKKVLDFANLGFFSPTPNLLLSSANAKKWEVELSTLKNNNARLTSALQESTANVEEWKRQLHSYKEENTRLKVGLIELEAGRGNCGEFDAVAELRNLKSRIEELEAELRERDEEVRAIKQDGSAAGTAPAAAAAAATTNGAGGADDKALAVRDKKKHTDIVEHGCGSLDKWINLPGPKVYYLSVFYCTVPVLHSIGIH